VDSLLKTPLYQAIGINGTCFTSYCLPYPNVSPCVLVDQLTRAPELITHKCLPSTLNHHRRSEGSVLWLCVKKVSLPLAIFPKSRDAPRTIQN